MVPLSVRRWCRRRWCWRGAAGALLLLAGALCGAGGGGGAATTAARFPRVPPARLAHLLADFSSHLRLYPHLGEWTVEEESSNYTSWRYVVSYACGARCRGRAAVLARDHYPPERAEHAAPPAPRAHTVHVQHRSCSLPALLPWPETCDEWETETEVWGDDAGGAEMRERARGGCGAGVAGAARALLPAAAPLSCAARLRTLRQEHLQRLRALLHDTITN